MSTIEEDILKALGYVPKSSCQPITTTPTSIRDRIFAILGYIPASQCIPITPTNPPITCPSGDVQAVNGQCPSGYTADPNNHGCCMPVTVTTTPPPSVTNQYNINIVARSGGSVSPSGSVIITSTTSPITVTATANSGYQFTTWVIDSTNVGSNNPVSLSYSVLQGLGLSPGNYTLAANFSPSTTTQPSRQYTVTFIESGLPSGTSWSVTFNNVTKSSNFSIITFTNIANGTYSYAISTSQYNASPSSGSITINNANVTQNITFTTITTSRYIINASSSNNSCSTVYPLSATISSSSPSQVFTCIPATVPITSPGFTIGSGAGATGTGSSSGLKISWFQLKYITSGYYPQTIQFTGSVTYKGLMFADQPMTVGLMSSYPHGFKMFTLGNGNFVGNLSINPPYPNEVFDVFVQVSYQGQTVLVHQKITIPASEATASYTPSPTFTITNWTLDGIPISQSSNQSEITLTLAYLQGLNLTTTTHTLIANVICPPPPPPAAIYLNVTAGIGGSVSPSGTLNITNLPTSTTFTATPNSGYLFNQWTLNESTISFNPSISLSSISSSPYLRSDRTNYLVATFFKTGTITYLHILSSGGGTVSPSGTYNIANLPTSTTFTATPNSGHQFSGWILNGKSISTATSLTFSSISSYLLPGITNSLVALFPLTTGEGETYLSISSSGGGSVSPAGVWSISSSPISKGFTAIPSPGYQFSGWTLNGKSISTATSLSFSSISSYLTQGTTNYLIATFTPAPTYLIVASGAGGSVSSSGTYNIANLSPSTTFTATPNSGYLFVGWTLNVAPPNSGHLFSQRLLNGNTISIKPSLSFSSISSYLTPGTTNYLVATFYQATAGVTYLNTSSSGGGTISPSGTYNIANLPALTPFAATPNSRYQFVGWTLNGAPLSIISSPIYLSDIGSLLKPGMNNLIANFLLTYPS
ncbi:MAG: hypothetical protein QXV17_11790 [Candidatus Micrarchaeaceae archaeon]